MNLKDLLSIDDEIPDTVDAEACPGCGSRPGDGRTDGCDDPLGCGYFRSLADGEDPEACPGCGAVPGDGPSASCDDPMGCGHYKGLALADAMADTQRAVKQEGDKFNSDAYMEETLRIEEARRLNRAAKVVDVGYGKVRQLRIQESPHNRTTFK